MKEQTPGAIAFGKMLRHWRLQQGWTQYTAGNWGELAGFKIISYGNLSVLENGIAGQLRCESFVQLEHMNERIAQGRWDISDAHELAPLIKAAKPIGDDDCPVWTAVEFWACYMGRRPVPPHLETPPPVQTLESFLCDAGMTKEVAAAVAEYHRFRKMRESERLTFWLLQRTGKSESSVKALTLIERWDKQQKKPRHHKPKPKKSLD